MLTGSSIRRIGSLEGQDLVDVNYDIDECNDEIAEMFDLEHSIDEDRYIAIGKVGEVLFVVFTERKDTIRLISARLATNAERKLYYNQNIDY